MDFYLVKKVGEAARLRKLTALRGWQFLTSGGNWT